MKIIADANLRRYSAFQTGGKVKYLLECLDEYDLEEAFDFVKNHDIPYNVFSHGTNIIFKDGNIDGALIYLKPRLLDNVNIQRDGDDVYLEVSGFVIWDSLVNWCVENNIRGLENMSGIPGTIGAGIRGNIGAYGKEICEVVDKVYTINSGLVERVYTNTECEFEYRESIFKKTRGKEIIIKAIFRLDQSLAFNTSYYDIEEYFKEHNIKADISTIRKAVLDIRKRKGMLLGMYKSCGSFFKNPVIDKDKFENIAGIVIEKREKAGNMCCRDPWFWQIGNEKIKISAACLLCVSGFYPGYSNGKAGISPRHPLSLINLKTTKSQDIIDLAQKITDTVYGEFGIKLEWEVEFIDT